MHRRSVALAAVVALACAAPVLSGGAAVSASHDGAADQACPVAAVPEDGFPDVSGTSPHEPAVDCAVWWRVTDGVTWAAFQPGTRVSRGQMASFVARTMEAAGAALPATPRNHFDDDDDNPHERRIDQLAELGVVSGTGERTYAPGAPVVRSQALAILVRGYEAATGEDLPAGGDHFDDDDGSVHESAIDTAAEAGWARGSAPRRIEPHATLRRDQMASLLVRALDTAVERGHAQLPEGFASGPAPDLGVELVTDAAVDPVHVLAAPGDERLFVVERAGRIRVLDGGGLSTWLDLRGEVTTGGERGMLGAAFAPGWPTDGRIFVSWTDGAGDSRLAAFAAGPEGADPATRHLIAHVDQPAANHNGGHVTFGPDGLLWWGLGDGGGSNDTYGNAQDPSTPLGGLHRFDVRGDPSVRPAGNPFPVASMWAIGLRNPWRFSFDASTGQLYVADVGQGSWEEVGIVPARRPGLNHGWPVMEGRHCIPGGCDPSRYVVPQYEYPNGSGGCSVTGGVVYRGTDIPALRGHYLLSDYCAGFLRTLRSDGSGVADVRDHPAAAAALPGQVVSIGTDARGEAYVVSFAGIYRVVPA